MKLKKGKTYSALFLSDVHYLLDKRIKNHRHKELFTFLDYLRKRKIQFETVCLVGDMIENWFFDGVGRLRKGKKRFAKLFDRLDAIAARGGRKIFVVGNHDTTSFTMTLDRSIEARLLERGYEICERAESTHWTAIHGHQGQYNRVNWFFSILILRILHGLGQWSPRFFAFSERFYNERLNRHDPTTLADKLAFYRRLSRVAHPGDRVLIAGHTHDFLCIPELNIINTGDWVESRTFVVQQGRRFTGLRMSGRKEFNVEFRLSVTPGAKSEPPASGSIQS